MPETVSDQPEKRARLPETRAEMDPETFALTLESRGTLTYKELNEAASDLHGPDPEEMWSNDLGWVPKPVLEAAREKEVPKLQGFDTFEEVPQTEAEGQEIVSSQFVDKWEASGELRGRLVSRGYEANLVSCFTLCCHTVGHGHENCAGVGFGTGRGPGRGGHFWSVLACCCGSTVFCQTAC